MTKIIPHSTRQLDANASLQSLNSRESGPQQQKIESIFSKNSKNTIEPQHLNATHPQRRKTKSVIYSERKSGETKKVGHGKGRNAHYQEASAKVSAFAAASSLRKRQLLESNLHQLQSLNIFPPLGTDESQDAHGLQAEKSLLLPNIET